jgi:hypothetical protein
VVAEPVSSPTLLQLSMSLCKLPSTLPPMVWSPSTNVPCDRNRPLPNPHSWASLQFFWDSFQQVSNLGASVRIAETTSTIRSRRTKLETVRQCPACLGRQGSIGGRNPSPVRLLRIRNCLCHDGARAGRSGAHRTAAKSGRTVFQGVPGQVLGIVGDRLWIELAVPIVLAEFSGRT